MQASVLSYAFFSLVKLGCEQVQFTKLMQYGAKKIVPISFNIFVKILFLGNSS